MHHRAEAELDGEASSVEVARAFVRATLAAWEVDDIAEVAALVTSELAANAVVHARSVYRVGLECCSPDLVIEVTDHSTSMPRLSDLRPDREGGRGLHLVDRLAKAWGSRLVGEGKTVWAVLALQSAAA